MSDRARPIRKAICLNEQELNLVQHKMRQLGTHNFGAYARKMLIDGYIIKVDYTEQKKLAAAVSRAATTAEAGAGHSQPEKTPPLRSLRHGHPCPLRQGKILPRLRQGGSPPAEGESRPQTALGRRQFRVEKPLNGKPSRTTEGTQQYDFPRSPEIEFYLST